MAIELFENKQEGYMLVKDGNSILRLTLDEFSAMRRKGISPLLSRLWDEAKKERKGAAKT